MTGMNYFCIIIGNSEGRTKKYRKKKGEPRAYQDPTPTSETSSSMSARSPPDQVKIRIMKQVSFGALTLTGMTRTRHVTYKKTLLISKLIS